MRPYGQAPLPPGLQAARERSSDIPRIRFFSLLGAESVLWGVVIAHLVKWAVSFSYFAAWQVRYAVGYGSSIFTVWYAKDWWDRLPVHTQNVLGQHWLASQAPPAWWVTARHDIRDVGISLIATIIVRLMFSKPKYPAGDNPGLAVYLTRVPLAVLAAGVPIALVAVLAWRLPWVMGHGVQVPARFGALAAEANGWLAAGTWVTVLMGIGGGLAATRVIQRVADDVQWFFAGRSTAKIRRDRLTLAGNRIVGTPSHRKRVRWLLDNQPDLPERSPWLVRGLVAAGFIVLAFSGAGAWLDLVGPAAPR